MTPAQYEALVDRLTREYPAEMAARLIEARCHPPYRRPRRDVLFPPAGTAGSEGEAAGTQGGAA